MTQTDDESARLEELGYTSEFKREMSLTANFSLGFTYLSPVVATYTLFALALTTGGPPMIWWLVIVGVGQFFVALVFGEVVSQYPVAGGVYPWARRLWGRRWAWMTGWVYLIALLVTIGGVVYGSGPYLALLLDFSPGTGSTVTCALIMLAVALALNMLGTKILAVAATIGFVAEFVGALIVGGWLLLTERNQNLSALFDTQGIEGPTGGGYLGAFLAAAIIGVYQYYGFEACGDVAEEVPNPTVVIPRAMRMTIYIGGAASILVCLSLLLAVPDFGAVISGENPDPVIAVLNSAFGEVGTKFVLVVVMISFLSCTLSLMAAASRLMYSYARDDMIFGSPLLRKFDHKRHLPPYSMVMAAVIPALIVLGSTISEKALTQIVSFAILGIYMGFQMVVLAALRARLKGWVPSGAFTLGRWGMPVTVIALAYGVLTMINIAWPRTPDVPWYDNWIVALSAVVGVGIGALYMTLAKPYLRSNARWGDAVPDDHGGGTTSEPAVK